MVARRFAMPPVAEPRTRRDSPPDTQSRDRSAMRRKLNFKFLFLLGAIVLVVSGGMAVAHHRQYKRLPLALLRQSIRAESDKDWLRADDYLTRYLSFHPGDVEQKA